MRNREIKYYSRMLDHISPSGLRFLYRKKREDILEFRRYYNIFSEEDIWRIRDKEYPEKKEIYKEYKDMQLQLVLISNKIKELKLMGDVGFNVDFLPEKSLSNWNLDNEDYYSYYVNENCDDIKTIQIKDDR